MRGIHGILCHDEVIWHCHQRQGGRTGLAISSEDPLRTAQITREGDTLNLEFVVNLTMSKAGNSGHLGESERVGAVVFIAPCDPVSRSYLSTCQGEQERLRRLYARLDHVLEQAASFLVSVLSRRISIT